MSGRLPKLRGENRALRLALRGIAILFLLLIIGLPLSVVFFAAFAEGWRTYIHALLEPNALAAISLTLLTVAIVIPLHVVFGIAAAWAIAKFDFRGKSLLLTLIDLPLSVSPVIVGLLFVLVFGRQGWLGPLLAEYDVKILFAFPSILLVTLFVTFPFVARELIPLMENQGRSEEEAALSLGAGFWMILRRVTLPNIKWGLLYGVLITNARGMGEFGAVSVVSGHILGRTMTMPLYIEALYDSYEFAAAFAIASLLAIVALAGLGIEALIDRRRAKRGQPKIASSI